MTQVADFDLISERWWTCFDSSYARFQDEQFVLWEAIDSCEIEAERAAHRAGFTAKSFWEWLEER